MPKCRLYSYEIIINFILAAHECFNLSYNSYKGLVSHRLDEHFNRNPSHVQPIPSAHMKRKYLLYDKNEIT